MCLHVKEMEADHGAGTVVSGPCQPLKEALWPACLERFKLENKRASRASTVWCFYEQG